ncbi:MAG: SpoIVB peptidase [Intestinimonas sp.]|nr:SpoIVB peptidase [Intestinimonas sp.]
MNQKEQQDPSCWALSLLMAIRALALGLAAVLVLQALGTSPRSTVKAEPKTQPAAALAASPHTLVPLGRAVGIKMFSEGVMVVGLSDITGESGPVSPARACGLKTGDIITHINSTEVNSIENVQAVLQEAAGERMSIRAVRGDKGMQFTAQAVKCTSDGAYKLGAWIRDSMAGIGTMTFYDPETGQFGALGHGINDIDTTLLMPLESGSVMYASVSDVQKGQSGTPGELHGVFQLDRDIGSLYANTSGGVFGTLTDNSFASGGKALEVAARTDVRTGPATILSNIAGDSVEEYQVEITKVFSGADGDTRDLMLKVTDPRLLNATGGIVQGMSGSPILQNGKFVGAVTHVLVNDPTQGYGILITSMLDHSDLKTNAKIA